MTRVHCKDCIYFDGGVCKESPPRIAHMLDAGGIQILAIQELRLTPIVMCPPVAPNDWCGKGVQSPGTSARFASALVTVLEAESGVRTPEHGR